MYLVAYNCPGCRRKNDIVFLQVLFTCNRWRFGSLTSNSSQLLSQNVQRCKYRKIPGFPVKNGNLGRKSSPPGPSCLPCPLPAISQSSLRVRRSSPEKVCRFSSLLLWAMFSGGLSIVSFEVKRSAKSTISNIKKPKSISIFQSLLIAMFEARASMSDTKWPCCHLKRVV